MAQESFLGSTFEFSPRLSDCSDGEALSVPMSPADELFCNGRIRAINPSSAVPQKTPLLSFEHQGKAQKSSVTSEKGNDMEQKCRGRQRNENRNRYRCPARSLSPQRNSGDEGLEGIKVVGAAASTLLKAKGSRKKWSLTDIFFRRCKSDGAKLDKDEMELSFSSYSKLSTSSDQEKKRASAQAKPAQRKEMTDSTTNRTAYISSPNRRVSAHELHYTANRAQSEELRRKTLLPYKQGVLGCLPFSSPPASPQGHVLQSLY